MRRRRRLARVSPDGGEAEEGARIWIEESGSRVWRKEGMDERARRWSDCAMERSRCGRCITSLTSDLLSRSLPLISSLKAYVVTRMSAGACPRAALASRVGRWTATNEGGWRIEWTGESGDRMGWLYLVFRCRPLRSLRMQVIFLSSGDKSLCFNINKYIRLD